MNLYDTIAAISTPIGEGGISVLRVSGDETFKIVGNIFFKDKNGENRFDISLKSSHTIHFGYIFENDSLIDEVLVSIFKTPHSYTGEDLVEISTHGGAYIVQRILPLLLKSGARHAEPGEFTKRAFLNGKIDLSQAEAVADLIKAKTETAHLSSIKQLEGSLSEFVKSTRQDLIDITSLIELELDFAEEDLEFVKKDELKEKIQELSSKIESVLESYITGKIIREGINLVIAGKPNSGKSSLFNYLLKTNRAIVSTVPGTTRDYIEESLNIKGVLFNLIDTAGLRMSSDEIESEGVKRSFAKIDEADLVLYLIDSSENIKLIDECLNYFKKNFNEDKSLIVFTKIDIASKDFNKDGIKVSIYKDESIERLKEEMIRKVVSEDITKKTGSIILTNMRHKICLENVILSLNNAVNSINNSMSGEYISVDLRNALNFLGKITGEVTNEDILNNIFQKFCVGK
ncbi:MAG: tRNA uridine-5-carboxymethylaminomethyl(34) synthesis GTPase MnmE [Ignavibacteria bacterium]|nr:tRNA uridine-5-carboxymethylaminomethyl(34) synthesis GTPase MnmE [Ignavibacteria bacterium]